MTELRDYILSKLQEQLGKAQRNPAGEKAVADWKMKRRVGKPGGPVRVGQSHTGEAAALHMEKQAGELKGKLKSRAFRGLGQTKGGMRAWSNIQQGHSPDARQDASTDLRTQLMYILADKLDEAMPLSASPKQQVKPVKPVKPPKPLAHKYSGVRKPPITEELKARIAHILADKIDEVINPSFKVDKQEIEARKTRGMKPFPTTNKPTPNKAQLMRDAAKAAADAVKKPKPMPSITNTDVSQYLPKPPVKEWTERIIKILVEMKRPAHLQVDKYKISGAAKLQGLPQINKLRADKGKRPHQRSPLANDPKIDPKSKALASVFNKQPLGPGEEAKVNADKAKEAADRPRVEAGLAKFDRDPVVSRIRRNNRRWNR